MPALLLVVGTGALETAESIKLQQNVIKQGTLVAKLSKDDIWY